MNLTKKLPILFLALALTTHSAIAAPPAFATETVGTLPSISANAENHGVAGAFVGLVGDRVVVAGGSNFSQGYPWEGGEKQYTDNIYTLKPATNGRVESELLGDVKLPRGVAHGCNVTTNQTLYCFGGVTASGESRSVYAIKATAGRIQIDSLTILPEGFTPVVATTHKGSIYLSGVQADANALYLFNPLRSQWQRLAGCHGALRTAASVFVGQHNGRDEALYLIGGRAQSADKIELLSDVWEYIPLHNTWKQKGDVRVDGENIVTMFAGAVSYASGHILLFGGDDGNELLRRHDLELQIAAATSASTVDSLKLELSRAFTQHTGFSKCILAYHPITDTWNVLGEVEHPLPAVTTAVVVGKQILLPSGEISPGVRSAEIRSVTILETAEFGWGNYAVVIAYLLVMMAIGFYFSRKATSTEEFFKGGNKIPWWAAGISIFATALSAITFISIPAKAFSADWGMFMFNMTILMIVPVVIHFYLPFFRKLNVASAYEYLEHRFSAPVRYLASFFFCAFMFARIAIVLFLPSLALNAVTGIDIYVCILLMGLVTIAYCTMGGIEAVIWGDVIQGAILVGGAIVSLGYLIAGIDGGVTTLFDTAITEDKFNILNFAFDFTQPVIWVALLGGVANQLLTYTSDQSVIQRYITVKDVEGTKKGLWLNGWLSVPIAILFFLIGTALYVFFQQQPELLNVGMQNTDSIFPHFIMCRLPVGIAGLLIAAIFAAAMSTLSANINSTATVLTEDFYRKIRKDATDKQRMRFARISGVIVGGLGLCMAILLATFDIASLWDQFNLFLGLFTSGLGGLFMMGIFTKRIGTKSAVTGFFGSIVVLLLFNALSPVSFLLYGFIGLVSSLVVGYVSSFIYGANR